MDKLFVVRKYVWARSADEALKKSRKMKPDDVWVDDEWKKNHSSELGSVMGFTAYEESETFNER